MLAVLWQFLAEKLGDAGDESASDTGETSDERAGRFAGSLLDWSVHYSHGAAGSQQEAAREIAQIQEKAEILDDQDRHRT
jgi:hypothetical protein